MNVIQVQISTFVMNMFELIPPPTPVIMQFPSHFIVYCYYLECLFCLIPALMSSIRHFLTIFFL